MISSDARDRRAARVVWTRLDLILALERQRLPVSTVVLAGELACDDELVEFLHEWYPLIAIDRRAPEVH